MPWLVIKNFHGKHHSYVWVKGNPHLSTLEDESPVLIVEISNEQASIPIKQLLEQLYKTNQLEIKD